MWILLNPDLTINTFIKDPRDIVIDGIVHPKSIFTLWRDDELNGIRIFRVLNGTPYDPLLMECVKTEYHPAGELFQEVFTLKERKQEAPKENECLKMLKESLEVCNQRATELQTQIAELEAKLKPKSK